MPTLPSSLALALLPRQLLVGQQLYGVQSPSAAEAICLFRSGYGTRLGQEGAREVWQETLIPWLSRSSLRVALAVRALPFDEQLRHVLPLLQDGTEGFYPKQKGVSASAPQDPLTMLALADWDDIALDLSFLLVTPFDQVYQWPWPTFVAAFNKKERAKARQRLMVVGSAFIGAESINALTKIAGYGDVQDEKGNPVVTAKEEPLLSKRQWQEEKQGQSSMIDWSDAQQVDQEYRLYAEGWYAAYKEPKMSRSEWEEYKKANESPVPWQDADEVERRYQTYLSKWQARLEVHVQRAEASDG